MIILMIIIFCEVARAPQAIFLPFLCARLSPELGETSEKGTKILIFSPAYRPEIVINKGGYSPEGGGIVVRNTPDRNAAQSCF